MKHLRFLIDVPKVGPVHYNAQRIYPERSEHGYPYDAEDLYEHYADQEEDNDVLDDSQR
jgi:hypothetical protein